MHEQILDDPTRRPFFQLYPQLWLSHPKMVVLDVGARGALMQLMCYAWLDSPPCTLPDDDAELAVLSGLHDRWPTHARRLRAFFVSTEEGRLLNSDLWMRFQQMAASSEAKSRAGKKGNDARWGHRATIAERSHRDEEGDGDGDRHSDKNQRRYFDEPFGT